MSNLRLLCLTGIFLAWGSTVVVAEEITAIQAGPEARKLAAEVADISRYRQGLRGAQDDSFRGTALIGDERTPAQLGMYFGDAFGPRTGRQYLDPVQREDLVEKPVGLYLRFSFN